MIVQIVRPTDPIEPFYDAVNTAAAESPTGQVKITVEPFMGERAIEGDTDDP